MIYCVWYPSGGFGHYINAILSKYGKGFARPSGSLTFSKNGNSHDIELIAPKFFKNPPTYKYDFDPAQNYSVLIDNGIDNEGTRFKTFFPQAEVIKICYDDFTWPVVAKTYIIKAMGQQMDSELVATEWSNNQSWVQREKYFLFLRDHRFRHSWKPDSHSRPVMINDLMDYLQLRQCLGLELDDFETFYQAWWDINQQYFDPVIIADRILQGHFQPVNDIWTQAVVYYQIWCKYGIEVPHNDYSNWFESYDHIVTMLRDNEVQV